MVQRVPVGPISGFPEWLPEFRLAEQDLLDKIRRQYELFGFASIETPVVERMEVLTAKGGIPRQIFTIGRPTDDDDVEANLGLHFDLTVPLARYVVQHADDLTFPFRRYQIQKVWRGERAQRGRFREFYQCDIDVIGSNTLDLVHDAEIPVIINSTFDAIGVGNFTIHISNRKILSDLLSGEGLTPQEVDAAVHMIDGFDSEDLVGLHAALNEIPSGAASRVIDLLQCKNVDDAASVLNAAKAVHTGLDELNVVVGHALALGIPPERLQVDFSIVRGLDYYTGTVYETFVTGQDWPSVCSGGRFDDLASYFTPRRFPGVGISIGASRLFDMMVKADMLDLGRKTPTEVLVTMQDRDRYLRSYLALGRHLRSAGLKTEVYLEPDVLGEQIGYASKKGIRIAVIAGAREFDDDRVTVRDLRHGSQETVNGDRLVDHIRRLLQS